MNTSVYEWLIGQIHFYLDHFSTLGSSSRPWNYWIQSESCWFVKILSYKSEVCTLTKTLTLLLLCLYSSTKLRKRRICLICNESRVHSVCSWIFVLPSLPNCGSYEVMETTLTLMNLVNKKKSCIVYIYACFLGAFTYYCLFYEGKSYSNQFWKLV